MLLVVPLLLLGLAAVLAPLLTRRHPTGGAALLALFPAAGAVLLAMQYPAIAAGGSIGFSVPWFPEYGGAFSLAFDGLSLLLSMLILGIGAIVTAYSGPYLGDHPQRGRFFVMLLAFQAAMLGVVLAGHVYTLFVAWELTGLTSYLLIGFLHAEAHSRHCARQAFLVTGAGGLAMLAGLIMLADAAGTGELAGIIAAADVVREDPRFGAIIVLVALGAFGKSGQVPLHFWLPNAMAAPTPVSALLHSATMVKAGVYLLARLLPVLGNNPLWVGLLVGVGAATMLAGALGALFRRDLKAILAGSTLSKLGLMVLLIGIGTPEAMAAMAAVMLAHGFYKASLFLVAGIVDHETHCRDVTRLRGLRAMLPITAVIAMLGALSKAGFPPFFGFVGKELSYELGVHLGTWAMAVLVAMVLANAAILVLAFLVGVHPFWGRAQSDGPHAHHEAPFALWWGPGLLAVLGLVCGLFPALPATWIVNPVVAALVPGAAVTELSLWHGFTPPLFLSLATFAIGLAVYAGRRRIWGHRLYAERPTMGDTAYNACLKAVAWAGDLAAHAFTGPSLSRALRPILAGFMVLIGGGLYLAHAPGVWAPPGELDLIGFGAAALVGIGVIGSLIATSGIGAIAALGAAGYGLALVFAWGGAPDLALTQICIETLALFLIVLSLRAMPSLHRRSTPSEMWADGLLAAGVGILVAALFLFGYDSDPLNPVGLELAQRSYVEAFGRNVVNVILVDFRALDTLGEIIVVALAGMGALTLFGVGFAPAGREDEDTGAHSVIFSAASRIVSPILLVLGLYALWRGHHLPGGGFIGGLAAAAAFLVVQLAEGPAAARRMLRVSPLHLMATGVLIAAVAGLPGLFLNDSFLTANWLPDWSVPLIGSIHIGTPLVFDIGIFLTVIGFTLVNTLTWAEEVPPAAAR